MRMARVRLAWAVPPALAGLAFMGFALFAGREWFEVHTTRLYCSEDPGMVRGFVFARIAIGFVGLAFVAAGLAISRWLARRTARGLLHAAARVGIAGVLALVVSDLCLRRTLHVPPSPLATCQLPPTRADARRSWAYPGGATVVLVDDGRPVTYAFDEAGDRVPSPGAEPDLTRPTLLFAGESVTLGLGLPWEETYPAIVGDRLRLPIVNASVHGYGDDQIYLLVKDRIAALQRPVAVVLIGMAELFQRDVADWRQRLRFRSDGSFEVVDPSPEWVRTSPLRMLLQRAVTLHDDEAIRIARATYAGMAREARARGAYPLVVFANYYAQCEPDGSGTPPIERRLFSGLDVDHIWVDLPRAWVIGTNGHPDARANQALAGAVVTALQRRGVGVYR
jgi:hypothetical protein